MKGKQGKTRYWFATNSNTNTNKNIFCSLLLMYQLYLDQINNEYSFTLEN